MGHEKFALTLNPDEILAGEKQKQSQIVGKTLISVVLTKKSGGLAGIRTLDKCLKRALLYQLSYQPTNLSCEN